MLWHQREMHPQAKLILAVSFLLVSLAGALMIWNYWIDRLPQVGIARAVAFVVFNAVLHVLGFKRYARQFDIPPAVAITSETRVEERPHLPEFFRPVLLQQVPVLLIAALVLDGGLLLRGCGIAAIAHWSLIALIHCRNSAPSGVDQWLVRWSFIPLVILIASFFA